MSTGKMITIKSVDLSQEKHTFEDTKADHPIGL